MYSATLDVISDDVDGIRRYRCKVRLFCFLYCLLLLPFANAFFFLHFSYGTAKSGVGISAMSVLRPDLMMKCVVPVIMAGIIAVCPRYP